ncbi:hypothetical protein CHS0354_014141 [Potamilus streckersoni]|uniref:Uncharacterized protein n=1 Tax=Potamilus streckersoni TaxID=2493646 RepID=A0AAE0WF39_9BIVA|nr:hypothetical protein CHS0354_014141 [Potamilus streckersoni]
MVTLAYDIRTVHIFFDDAFRKEVKNGVKTIKVNGYVKDLLDVVQETTGYVLVLSSIREQTDDNIPWLPKLTNTSSCIPKPLCKMSFQHYIA